CRVPFCVDGLCLPRLGCRGYAMPSSDLFMGPAPRCGLALGAVGDRSIRTPTSEECCSTAQRRDHPEEDPLVRVPRQQAVDQPPARADELTRQADEGVGEGLELQ